MKDEMMKTMKERDSLAAEIKNLKKIIRKGGTSIIEHKSDEAEKKLAPSFGIITPPEGYILLLTKFSKKISDDSPTGTGSGGNNESFCGEKNVDNNKESASVVSQTPTSKAPETTAPTKPNPITASPFISKKQDKKMAKRNNNLFNIPSKIRKLDSQNAQNVCTKIVSVNSEVYSPSI
jgi:hypothetical protein